MAGIWNIFHVMFPELILISCIQTSQNAAVPYEHVWTTKTTQVEQPRTVKDSVITFNLFDANGEWGELSEETFNNLQDSESNDFHFDTGIESLGLIITEETNDTLTHDDYATGIDQPPLLDTSTERKQDTEDLKVNKRKTVRLKRNASQRGLRRPPPPRTGLRPPPTPPPQQVPVPPWQINQGQTE